MTREEAIAYGNNYYVDLISACCGVDEKHKAFVRMSLKALNQESILEKIKSEIEPKCDRINSLVSVLPYAAHREIQELLCEIMNLCKAESDIEKRKECPHKPCINYEDGCEEWAGCPCVYYKAESEE